MSRSEFVSDEASIGRLATTPTRRVEALVKCLINHWADRDIMRVERVEDATKPGWRMEAAERFGREGAD